MRSQILCILLLGATSMLGSGCRLPHGDKASASYQNSPLTDSAEPPSEAAPSEDDLTEAFAHYGTGIIHEMDEEPELALQEYYESARKDPEDATLVLGVARRLLQANQLDKALSLLTYATSRPGASGAMFSYLGVVYSRLGKPDLANKANRSAIKRSPRLFLGYQNLFLNELEARRKKAALAVLDEAARVPGTGPEFLIGLAELYANYGLQVPAEKPAATSRAVAALERARRLPVAEPELRLKLADGFDLLGKDDQAAEIYSGLLNPLPDDLLLRQNVRAKLANIYLREHKPKLAAE
ncbi:MAG TPA: tetratricopeptide repeat protein, partial [Verrucomicrobiae bacterium]|nr:tetratricopeptide repeat protein [Verrucomicrobiae bacterium]